MFSGRCGHLGHPKGVLQCGRWVLVRTVKVWLKDPSAPANSLPADSAFVPLLSDCCSGYEVWVPANTVSHHWEVTFPAEIYSIGF